MPGGAFWCADDRCCEVYDCAVGRELEHCGLCQDFPSDLLLSYAYHEQEGDRARVGNCAIRARIGTEAWQAREAAWYAARAARGTH